MEHFSRFRLPLESTVSTTRTTQSVQELRQMIAMLERSGIAEQRPEARVLLERSRAVLRQHQRMPRRVAGKLGTLVTLLLDATMLGGAMLVALAVLVAASPPFPTAFLAAIPLWLLFRLRHQAHWLAEGGRWAVYHLGWLGDWFAEAFSPAAMARLDARITARDVMWGWRQHRRALPHRATLDDVSSFLAVAHGTRAEREFRRAAEALGHAREWTARGAAPRNRAAARLAALRWSALIAIFRQIAASGAFWPDILTTEAAIGTLARQGSEAPTDGPPGPRAAPAAPAGPADTAERAARRADLRDTIRRKRQDITAAFGWQLKTEAEITQRDNFLARTRAEIADVERELAGFGG